MGRLSGWLRRLARDRFRSSLSINIWRGSKTMTDVQQSSKVEQVEAASLAAQLQKVPVFAGVPHRGPSLPGHRRTDPRRCRRRPLRYKPVPAAASGFCSKANFACRSAMKDGELTLIGNHGRRRNLRRSPFAGRQRHGSGRHCPQGMHRGLPEGRAFLEAHVFLPSSAYWRVWETWRAGCSMFQSQELHREKLISLGTMAAGLMHELNNPGAAARRAASQMRENLSRLQQISLRMCGRRSDDPGPDRVPADPAGAGAETASSQMR